MRLRLFLAASALALLSGCAGLTSHEALEGQGDAQTWKTHKQQLSELDAWQIDGKVGIRAPRDSGSGTLFWLQRQGYYDIRLSGPLGRGAEQLGWRLPVSHLLWWVRGLPAPDSKSRLTLDADSRLARLEQDGWQIEYTRYAEQNGYWLPERLKLHGQDLDVTLVIKDWQPRQLGR